jgi:hypothetical protein
METGMVSSNISRPSPFIFFHGIQDYFCIQFDAIVYNTGVEILLLNSPRKAVLYPIGIEDFFPGGKAAGT